LKEKRIRKKPKLLFIAVFAVAFAYIEAAVVVYLRALLYPNGFSFPLNPIPPNILTFEICREIATIVVLLSLSLLSKYRTHKRVAYFLFAFGVWDIFYYVWLKVLLNWPVSIFDWDVLFLIPLVWTSPVLAPVLVSITMIIWSLMLLRVGKINKEFKISGTESILLCLSPILVLLSFFWNVPVILRMQAPVYYPWFLLIIAETTAFYALFTLFKREER